MSVCYHQARAPDIDPEIIACGRIVIIRYIILLIMYHLVQGNSSEIQAHRMANVAFILVI